MAPCRTPGPRPGSSRPSTRCARFKQRLRIAWRVWILFGASNCPPSINSHAKFMYDCGNNNIHTAGPGIGPKECLPACLPVCEKMAMALLLCRYLAGGGVCVLFFAITANALLIMQIPTAEAEAMRGLRLYLQIENQTWPEGIRPCAWRGVTCRENHITGIDLAGVSPNSPPRKASLEPLRRLPMLRVLNMSNFPVHMPSWVGHLAALEVLVMENSSLQGPIPQSIGKLSNLRTLKLAHNNLSGSLPPELGWLPRIRYLDLSDNRLAGSFPDAILNASTLIALNLSGNLLAGEIPRAIGMLHNLEYFCVGNNNLGGQIPSRLWSLKKLNYLDMSWNRISGSLSALVGALSELTFLNLEYNNVDGSIPGEISKCSMLQVLKLGHNGLTGELPRSVVDLRNLRAMSLSFNALSGVVPEGLAGLESLQVLDLSFNQLYGPLPPKLEDMKSLVLMDLTGNFLNGSVPANLLSYLKVTRNCFHGLPKQHMLRACNLFYRGILTRGAPRQALIGINISATSHNHRLRPRLRGRGNENAKRTANLAAILGGTLGGLLLVLIIGTAVFCIQRHGGRDAEEMADKFSEGRRTEEFGATVTNMNGLGESFSYAQLLEATKKFSPSSLLKAGHTGDLYRGFLEGGAAVAVKRIDFNRVKRGFYIQELELFGKASHTRLVPLLGHCLERKDEKLLVYKYMPNGDLETVMRKKMGSNSKDYLVHPLDWISRLKIAIGIAEGLNYLHHECSPPIVHRDIKASSILLDEKFEVRLGSLSAARSQDGDSQPGLIARLLALSQSWDQAESGPAVATCANDIYSFGRVLLEIISGKIGTSECSEPRAEHSWIDNALPLIDIHDKETLPRIVDPYLIVDEDLLEEVWAVAIIAKACLNPKPSKRPSMRHVLKALENPRKVIRGDILCENVAVRTSSHSSWNEAFGSWRSSSASQHQQLMMIPGTLREEYLSRGNSKGRSSRRIHVRGGSNDIVSDHTQEG